MLKGGMQIVQQNESWEIRVLYFLQKNNLQNKNHGRSIEQLQTSSLHPSFHALKKQVKKKAEAKATRKKGRSFTTHATHFATAAGRSIIFIYKMRKEKEKRCDGAINSNYRKKKVISN